MALGGAGALRAVTMLEQLLEEINFQRAKEMRQLLKDESGFVVLQGTTYWTDLFVRHFLFQEEHAIDCDDLLFFVRKRHVRGSSRYLPKYETDVEVFRKDSKKLPIGDPEIDWEETVYLNLIVHQFEYTLTLAVCTRTSPKQLQVLRRHSQKVYASPSRRQMDSKGEGEEITYPHICFMVDNFDEVFCDMVVRDGEMVCVELVACARGEGAGTAGEGARAGAGAARAVIFLGSVRYDALTRVYDSRQSSLSSRVAQRVWVGLVGRGGGARCEFVRMKGPGGKGHAEVAVARARGPAPDTPSSEPGVPPGDLWDADWDQDPDDLLLFRHQRRLSDPSANLANYGRGVWRAKEKSRSENEGLDALGGPAEVEAGDVRDEHRGAEASSAAPDMRPLLAAPRAPPRAPPAVPGAPEPCEVAADAAALVDGPTCPPPADSIAAAASEPGVTVRGREELPCGCSWSAAGGAGVPGGGAARSYATLPRARGLGAALYRGAGLPPRRTAVDGTEIYYWCDAPRRPHELDDGASNPLWAMRGFTQTFHLWKEGKRAQSAPLTAYLTYVTLPWWNIAKDILDLREEPILTF